jgi:Spy/CpxP family protein refolding chaperone
MVVVMVLILPAVAVARGGPGTGMKGGGPGGQRGGFGMGPGGPMGAWWNDSEVQKKLALTDDQVKKLQESVKERRGKLVDLKGELQKREMELQDLMEADPPDVAKIQALTDQIIAARGRLQKEFMGMMLQVRVILAKAQWQQLRELRNHEGRGGDRGHGGSGGPGGPDGPDGPMPGAD